jgi:F-type H+-transporting ATPase subunit c
MILDPHIFRYLGCGISLALSALGIGLGQGIAGHDALVAFRRQPTASSNSFRTLMVGLALSETGGILSFLMVIMLLFFSPPLLTSGAGIAEMGMALSMGIAACFVGYASSMAVKEACNSIARQPFFVQKIAMFMVLLQSVVEAPLIFVFIIALMVKSYLPTIDSYSHGMIFFCSNLLVALGCVGPALGQARFVAAACRSLGTNKDAYGPLFTFSVLCVAVIETPVIMSLIVAFILLYRPYFEAGAISAIVVALTCLIAMGGSSFGTGNALGYIASRACSQIAKTPENYSVIFRTALISIGFVESSVVYALIIAMLVLIRY